MFHKYTLIKVTIILFLLDLIAANVLLNELEIRHMRSRLMRARRHGNHFNKIKKLSSDFENIGNINWFTTEEPLILTDNITITTKDEKIILKLALKPYKTNMNVKTPGHSNNSWQHIDKTVLYMGDRILSETNIRERGKSASEMIHKVEDTGDIKRSNVSRENDMEQGKTFDKSDIARNGHVDIVTRFLRIVESQHLLGENCTAGTDLNLGEGVVDRYAQERFRVEADVAVNRANMLTRLWKYADRSVVTSDYLLSALVFSMVEFNDVIFAAGNCYDKYQYKNHLLFCPYAYRLPEGGILVKDLAVEYNYLSNTSEWFFIARKNAENVIKNHNQFSTGELYKKYVITPCVLRSFF